MTDGELDRLVDFLRTLTDESFKPQEPARLPSGLAPVHDDNAPTGIILTGEDINE